MHRLINPILLDATTVGPTIPLASWFGVALAAAVTLVGFLFHKWIDNVSEQDKSSTQSLNEKLITSVKTLEDKISELKKEFEVMENKLTKMEEKYNSVSYKTLEKIQELRIIIAEKGGKTGG